MFRIIAGVIVGWIVMSVIVIATFAVTWMALGAEKTFKPDSYWTTDTFNIAVLIGGFIASILGGIVCGLIARNRMAGFALVAIVLAFGLGGAVMNQKKPDPPARTGELKLEDIGTYGKEPTWFAFTKVAVAAVGVLIGSSLVSRKATSRG